MRWIDVLELGMDFLCFAVAAGSLWALGGVIWSLW